MLTPLTPDEIDPNINVLAFSQLTAVCPQTVRAWAKAGVIPHFKIGRTIRIPRRAAMTALARYYKEAREDAVYYGRNRPQEEATVA